MKINLIDKKNVNNNIFYQKLKNKNGINDINFTIVEKIYGIDFNVKLENGKIEHDIDLTEYLDKKIIENLNLSFSVASNIFKQAKCIEINMTLYGNEIDDKIKYFKNDTFKGIVVNFVKFDDKEIIDMLKTAMFCKTINFNVAPFFNVGNINDLLNYKVKTGSILYGTLNDIPLKDLKNVEYQIKDYYIRPFSLNNVNLKTKQKINTNIDQKDYTQICNNLIIKSKI